VCERCRGYGPRGPGWMDQETRGLHAARRLGSARLGSRAEPSRAGLRCLRAEPSPNIFCPSRAEPRFSRAGSARRLAKIVVNSFVQFLTNFNQNHRFSMPYTTISHILPSGTWKFPKNPIFWAKFNTKFFREPTRAELQVLRAEPSLT